MLQAIGYATGQSLYHRLRNQALGLIILTCAGSLPGYWCAIFTVDTFGRKPLQVFGFLTLTVVFAVIGFAMRDLTEGSLLALYIVSQFLFNAGPNTTTFIVPSECFPTRYRATAHGLSAAMGKLGAIVAQGISIPLLRRGDTAVAAAAQDCHGDDACSPFLHRLLQLFALFMLLGTLVSLLIPETKGVTLEELAGEPHTSYNDGCNGSIKGLHLARPWWHPRELLGFCGAGRPAGFNYHHNGARWTGGGTRATPSPRLGIMASPQLVATTLAGEPPQTAEHSRSSSRWGLLRGGSSRIQKRSSTVADSEEIAMMRRGGAGGDDNASEETAYIRGHDGSRNNLSNATAATASGGLGPPTWGAGWGRIDRGSAAPTSELRDVGMLLKD